MYTNQKNQTGLGCATCSSQCAKPWGITYQSCKFDRQRVASDCGCGSCDAGLEGVSTSGVVKGLSEHSPSASWTPPRPMSYAWNPWGFWRPWYGYRTVYTRPPETLAENVTRQVLQATANYPQSGEAVGYIAGQMAALRSKYRSDIAIIVPQFSDSRWYTPWTQDRFTREFLAGVRRVQEELRLRHASSFVSTPLMASTASLVWALLKKRGTTTRISCQ